MSVFFYIRQCALRQTNYKRRCADVKIIFKFFACQIFAVSRLLLLYDVVIRFDIGFDLILIFCCIKFLSEYFLEIISISTKKKCQFSEIHESPCVFIHNFVNVVVKHRVYTHF